ncbi:MAG TPA: aryl-sulfate sulfotransferase [Longimicrobiales bacterium]
MTPAIPGARARRSAVVFLCASLLALGACEDDPARPDNRPAHIVSASVVDTAGPITRWLRVDLDRPGAVDVFYEPVDGGRTFRMRADSAAESHEIYLPRLLSDTTYDYAVRVFDEETASDSIVRGTFVTGTLPTSITNIDIDVEGDASFEVMIVGQGQNATAGMFGGQIGIEPDGTVVWYFASTGFPLAAQPMPGSHDLAFLDGGQQGIVRVAPDGHIVARLVTEGGVFGSVHHDIAPNGPDRILFIQKDTQTVGPDVITGEALWEWNTTTGAVEEKWSVFDHLDWNTDRTIASQKSNWLHANALSMGPRGNVVMSLNRLNQVISIAPDFQSLEWRLGGPNETHALAPQDTFVMQHSTFELPGNRVILFDNVAGGSPDAYSRAMEFQLEADTAYVIWEYVPEPTIQADLRSGIYRLANGNSLVTFSVMPLIVDEVDPAGQRVWRFTGHEMTPAFRAVPLESIAGEVRVDAMP